MKANHESRLARGVVGLAVVGSIAGLGGTTRAARPANAAGVDPTGVDAYFQRASNFGFSGSVVVGAGGKLLFHRGYGYADWKARIPATSATAFDLASLDKQFLATAILKLEEQGTLHVTDHLDRFFDFVPADKQSVTLEQLLTQTSGITDVYWDARPELTLEEFVRYVLVDTKLTGQPGTRFGYASANYWIVQCVIEKVTGGPFENYLRETLFAPAGMMSTGTVLPHWKPGQVAHLRSLLTGDWAFKGTDYGDLLGRRTAFRTLLSTADDLFRWYVALRGDRLLSGPAKRRLFTPALANYAYGWNVVPTSRGTRLIEHGGGGTGGGMRVTFRYFPDEDVFFSILSGAVDPSFQSDYIGKDVEAILFGGSVHMPPPSPGETGRPAGPQDIPTGTYQLPNGARFEIGHARDARTLLLTTSNKNAITLLRFPDLGLPPDTIPQDIALVNLVRSMLAGDSSSLRARFIGSSDMWARYVSNVDRLRLFAQPLGAVTNVTTVYERSWDFNGAPEFQSFIGIRGESSDAVVRVLQDPGQNLTFNPVSVPDELGQVLASTSTGYVVWDFTLGKAVRLATAQDSEGHRGIDLRGQYGAIRATRVAPTH